ncbi:hypothetical protein [Dyella acidisoli]|uniref:Transposase n=1 Tax=Dyella acidisoli TaxID=1867834 RepID=A0ABQ5XSM2_9GAMM|nr:hypothetical protein [Dyella acidisoli]GLQ94690.1 hypothetical protein GCM10007901_36420 [Dyella acidisoli]
MFASFANSGDLFKGLIMLYHVVKFGLPSRGNRAALPCVRDEQHRLTLNFIH